MFSLLYKVEKKINKEKNYLKKHYKTFTTPCPEKRDRQYFGRNFDNFRQLFIIVTEKL